MGRSSTKPLRSIGEFLPGVAYLGLRCFVAVSLTLTQHSFADRDSRSSSKIGLGPILNNPAALLEEEINLLPEPFVRGAWVGQTGRSGYCEIACRILSNRSLEARNLIGICDEV